MILDSTAYSIDPPHLEAWLVDDGNTDNFADWLTRRLNAGVVLALDTETTGVQWWKQPFLRLLQISDDTEGWAIPAGPVARWAVERIVEAATPVVMHHASFDMHALESAGFPLPAWGNVHDTMLLHSLVEPASVHALKNVCSRLFGPWASRGQSTLHSKMKQNKWDWATVPIDLPEYWGYGVMDAIVTRRLFDVLPVPAAYDRERKFQSIMYRAERRGVGVDLERTNKMHLAYIEERYDLGQKLAAIGIGNPNANRQIEVALVALGWEADAWTATGQARLDKEVYAELARNGSPLVRETVDLLVRWKRLNKWNSTYLEHFIQNSYEGRIHPVIRTIAARTGRSSIADPPLQTLPKGSEIRHCLVPDEGHHLWAIDYAGQEMRLFASYAGEQAMIQELVNGDGDMHLLVARMVYGQHVGKEHPARQIAKVVNFAKLYGAGPAKLAQAAGVTVDEMREFLHIMDERFPQAAAFTRRVEELGRQRLLNEGEAYILTSGGRRVPADPDKVYTLLNYLIQGSGADVLKEAVLRLDAAGLADNIVLPIHDELLLQFPTGETDAPRQAAAIMEDHSFAAPLTTDITGPMRAWGLLD